MRGEGKTFCTVPQRGVNVFFLLVRALTELITEKQNNWDVFLDAMLFSLRCTVHTATQHSPFHLMYGREAVSPSQVPADVTVSEIHSDSGLH